MNRELTCFVPVDFSEGAYKAAEYAILLARLLDGKVELFHVVDPADIAESHNQAVVQRSIKRLLATAEARMKSLQEMIFEKWSTTVKWSVVIGPLDLIANEAARRSSVLVFLTRGSGGHRSLKRLLADIESPVIVVPATTTVKAPKEPLLVTDMRPISASAIKPLLKLARTTATLNLLYMNGRAVNDVDVTSWSTNFSNQFGVATQLVHPKFGGASIGVSLRNLIDSHSIDLVCTVRRRRHFLSQLFSESASTVLAMEAVVPTLILPELEANGLSNGGTAAPHQVAVGGPSPSFS